MHVLNKELHNYLKTFITEKRYDLFNKVLEERTRYITVALEDIYQKHNASAVLRTCDCFGIQDVHIIENRNEYKLSKQVTMGSDKWLTLNNYNEENKDNLITSINNLRTKGYRIVATTPHTNDVSLESFDLSKGKVALFFGTELDGLTDTMLENADEFLKIPMHGFTESFNISVSASIILHSLSSKLRDTNVDWKLSDKEKDSLILEWMRKTIKKSDLIEKNFIAKINKN
jgi:tRNA (guanosine-2'-O-)-methyltransferase